MRLRTSAIAAAVQGRLDGPDVDVDGASHDSRTVGPGQLFVPVVGERDGHEFIADALVRGAAAYFTSGPVSGGTAIVVDDTERALEDAGRLARSHLPERVVGITGSVGKTSVKDLLKSALARTFITTASERSFNNEIGVPLTLLGAPDGTEAVVAEMGARGIGHIAQLCAIASPTVGVVTRVAAVHTEVFGSVDDVARGKGELVEALPSHGAAILNAGDPRVAAMAARTDASVVTFGQGGAVHAVDVVLDDDLRVRFGLRSPWGEADVALGVRGVHQVDNALAAAAAALVLEVPVEEVAAGLAEARLSPWRMELATAPGGARILNDAYNANPTSVAAALESLAAIPAARRTAVLGVMAELGDLADEEHARIGALAQRLGIRLIAVDAPAYGGDDVAHADEALERLGPVDERDAVLVKGSRVAGLERLAAALLDRR